MTTPRRQPNQQAATTARNQKALKNQTFFKLIGKRSYDKDALYIATTNGHDHSTKFTVHMPNGVRGILEGIIAENTQYRSVEDFIRNSVFHAAWNVINNPPISLSPELEADIEMYRSLCEMAEMQLRSETRDEYLATARTTLNRAIEDGDWSIVSDVRESLDEMLASDTIPERMAERFTELSDMAMDALRTERRIQRQQRKSQPDPDNVRSIRQ